MIEKDITPRLEKLRTQRQDYMSYHKVCEDLERELGAVRGCVGGLGAR